MKLLKVTLLVAVLTVASSTFCNAQSYAKIEYWGKNYPIDQTFFQIINATYEQYMRDNAPNYRWYDPRDYNDIYVKMIDRLKDPAFTIIVTEANQLQFRSPTILFPGTVNEPGRGKKSMARASWMLRDVVLPSLQQYVANYNKVHQFQY